MNIGNLRATNLILRLCVQESLQANSNLKSVWLYAKQLYICGSECLHKEAWRPVTIKAPNQIMTIIV